MEIYDMHTHLRLNDKRSDEDILIRMERAGVHGFKIICSDFCIYEDKPMEALRYVFRWDARLGNIADFTPKGRFATALKERAVGGGMLDSGSGYILK